MGTLAKIKEVKEIPLNKLVIGKGQVRTSDAGKEIDELAESIKTMGLLEPIVVCAGDKKGTYEILTGQRRFLAHQLLKKNTILAAVLDKSVDTSTAKAISITENVVRRDPNQTDLIDACTVLFKKYGSARAVAQKTGLPYAKVCQFVKYDRLITDLQKLVDKKEVDLKTALRAQDAASVTGKTNKVEAVKLAKEMAPLSGAQQKKIKEELEQNPDVSVDDVIEAAKTGEKVTQVVVTLGRQAHRSLQTYSDAEGSTLDDAARGLIEEGLSGKGFLKDTE